jgi:hypothetical protein
MAHYAKVVDGIVTKVIVAEADFFDTFVDDSAGKWIQTSYNTHGGKHYDENGNEDNGTPLRKNFAGIGFTYDEQKDAFIPPTPFSSWVLNEESCEWKAPVEYPNDGKYYIWNENITNWTEVV